jgi:glutaredoxin
MVIVLYSREGCHLCTDALELLRDRQKLHGFHIEIVDVDSNSEMRDCFGDWVPVVTINGKVRFRGRIEPVLLDRLLATNQTD